MIDQRPQPNTNPRWDPQILVEVDTSQPLKYSIDLHDQEGNVIHSQPIVYKILPNACFKCHRQGHLIKDSPKMVKDNGSERDAEDFTTTCKKNNFKPKSSKPFNRSLNKYAPLLVDVEGPMLGRPEEEMCNDSPDKEKPSSSRQDNSVNYNADIPLHNMPSSEEDSDEKFIDSSLPIDKEFEFEINEFDSNDTLVINADKSLQKYQLAPSSSSSPKVPKFKRKKEKSADVNRVSVILSKPPKTSKK